ncbi:hypothetical protein M2G60_21765 [Vibrio vulnificus]|nr:hypothetical protein [Vibrio vulnificus]
MGISTRTHKLLWGKAAGRCSYPTCKDELVMEATSIDDESLIGEACHIVAKSEDGPRGNSQLSIEDRDKYSNLILMCQKHHKKIDDQCNSYSVSKLEKMKAEHERWVSEKICEKQYAADYFSVFQLFYNSFWIEEHTNFIRKNSHAYSVGYRNLIYTKINRCRILLESINKSHCNSMLIINSLYEEFDKTEENYANIHAFAFQLNNSFRNELKNSDNKNVVSIARSLVTFLRGYTLGKNISPNSFKQCCLDFFGFSDELLESYLYFESNDEELERKILDRLEELM